MTEFLCKVAQADGKRLTLRRSSVSESVLVRDLNNEGFLILKVEEAPSGTSEVGRLKSKAVLRLTEILETLTSNGLTIKEALGMARPLGGKELGGFLAQLDAKVQKGQSLHQALKAGPKGFSPLYLGLIRIGEQTGDLNTILPRLAEYLKARMALREKTINALVYPTFVLVIALLGVALLALFVLPSLTESISGVNPDVARQYQQNVASFQFGASVLFGILLGFTLLIASLRIASRRSPSLAQSVDRLLLKLPLAGPLAWQSFCLHVSFSLEILLASGFSLESALGECDSLVTNRAIAASWKRVRDQVVKGSSLSRALRAETGYPEIFLGWIEVGEAAHDLKKAFHHLRAFYQNQSELLSTRFANLAEPTLIVVVGLLIITLVMTFVTPIFTMLGRII